MATKDPSLVTTALATIFSWAVLATASIIISGSLLAARFPLAFVKQGKLLIPLGVLSLRADKDQVYLGLMSFIFSLSFTVIFGGATAYKYFVNQAGIDVGQWNTLCIIASAFCLVFSLMIYIAIPLFDRSSPILSSSQRTKMLERLEELGDE
jgi:hypothetical protein